MATAPCSTETPIPLNTGLDFESYMGIESSTLGEGYAEWLRTYVPKVCERLISSLIGSTPTLEMLNRVQLTHEIKPDGSFVISATLKPS